jgi:tetratricopeptide (TPR) repeat protein
MYSNRKWISKIIFGVFVTCGLASAASGQRRVWSDRLSLLPPDEARQVFNAGLTFYDQYRFADAENKFREVVRRFPKNPIADRADYYLIRTLAQVGKRVEALSRIDAFAKQYPNSRWQDDVQELRIQLTDQIPARAETILLRTAAVTPQAPPPPEVTPSVQVTTRVPSPFPPGPPLPPFPFGVNTFQSSDPEVSLQQEIMRAMFRNNGNRAIEIATERLKANPIDPVVLSSLNLIAASQSAQAMPMLLRIVKNSSNPKARRDAIFWLGQSRGDKDTVVDTLTGLLPTLADDDSEAVAYTLSQIRSDKSLNALAAMARDKNKSEKVRNNAVFWIGQSRVANRVGLLDDIYKNSMDNSKIRQQVLYALNQTREPQAVTMIGNIASTDPDIEVRKQAVFWLEHSKSPEANQALEKLLQRR